MQLKLNKPTFKEEETCWDMGITSVIGLDEVGRGAFAGPITAAGVIFPINFKHELLSEIRDSKKLTSKKREILSEFIKENSRWTIKSVSVDFINKHGIGEANKEVFSKVLKKLTINDRNHFILVDGFNLQIPNQKSIINGDNISMSIASASIIAKVYRDNKMIDYSKKYPEYGFELNKGYGTLMHRKAIKKNGQSTIHRTSFNYKV